MSIVDARAKQILFAAVDAEMRWEKPPPRADLAYAKSKRMLFTPVTATHDQILARTARALDKLTLARVADAFLASLTSNRLDLRSGLGSFVQARSVKKHACDPFGDRGHELCYVCQAPVRRKLDLSFESFSRHFGPPSYANPVYRMLDLEELARASPPALMKGDIDRMNAILRAIAASSATDTPAKLNTRLTSIVGEDRNARDALIDALAVSGVIAPAKLRASDRWHYAAGWRGSDGYDAKRVKALFGRRGVS